MKIRLGHFFGLGDTLWITPIYKVFKNTETFIYDTPRNRSMAFLFDGLTTIRYEKEEFPPLDYHYELFNQYGKIGKDEFLYWKTHDPIHLATKLFKYLGVDESNSIIPSINVSEECIDLGYDLLNKIGEVSNPIILIANNTAGLFQGKEANDWQAAYRTLHPECWKELIDNNYKNHTFLQCGIDGRVFTFSNTIPVYKYIKNYENPLKAITGLFFHIKKYIGVDTGDYNLMLSVGGECKVLIPEKAAFWNGVSSIFREENYKHGEVIKTEYFNFCNYKSAFDKKLLSF